MTLHTTDTHVFSVDRDLLDATSIHRPDAGHVVTDPAGHAHPWCGPDGTPAAQYDPSIVYTIPSLVWVKDGDEYWEDDDEPHEVGHYACRTCGAPVVPSYTADAYTTYIYGMAHYRIDGVEVEKDEFTRRFDAAKAIPHD